jgi:hypothetical protein
LIFSSFSRNFQFLKQNLSLVFTALKLLITGLVSFRPSPLIHASSQHHFTHPLRKPPTFNSEEEFIRPSSNISPTAPQLTRQNLKNYPTDNHFSQQSWNIYQPKSQFTRQSSIRQESVQGPFQENLIQFKRPPSTLRDNAIPHSR